MGQAAVRTNAFDRVPDVLISFGIGSFLAPKDGAALVATSRRMYALSRNLFRAHRLLLTRQLERCWEETCKFHPWDWPFLYAAWFALSGEHANWVAVNTGGPECLQKVPLNQLYWIYWIWRQTSSYQQQIDAGKSL